MAGACARMKARVSCKADERRRHGDENDSSRRMRVFRLQVMVGRALQEPHRRLVAIDEVDRLRRRLCRRVAPDMPIKAGSVNGRKSQGPARPMKPAFSEPQPSHCGFRSHTAKLSAAAKLTQPR